MLVRALNSFRLRPVQTGRMGWIQLFLISLAVSLGAAPATLAAGRDSTGGDPAAGLFTNGPILRLEIQLEPKHYEQLAAYRFDRSARHEDRPDVPCTVREGGRRYTNVALHVKGGLGSFRSLEDGDVSLTLNFGKFADGQRFHGLRKCSLNSSIQDGSFLSEKLSRELYAAAGVPVPRADYALVTLNGRDLGLRVLAEGWDKPFLRRHFADADGNLYDNGPTGRDVSDADLQVSSGEHREDHTTLSNLVAACRLTNHAARAAALERTVDVDRLLSLYAMDSLCWNWDGFVLNRNNWRAYADPRSGRVTFMPHGLDQMFWKADGPMVPQPKCLVVRALMELPEMRARYLARLRELRTNVLVQPRIEARAADIGRRLASAVAAAGSSDALQARQFFLARISARLRDVDAQLAGFRPPPAWGTNWLRVADLPGTWQERAERAFRYTSNGRGPLTNRYEVNVTAPLQGLVMATRTVWLEAGRYTLEGRVRTTKLLPADDTDAWQGAGLSAWCGRKLTLGTTWGWFPYRASRDADRRGELVPTNAAPPRVTGDEDWQTLKLDFELRQPLADVELRCVVQRATGKAEFDLESLRLRRRAGVVESP